MNHKPNNAVCLLHLRSIWSIRVLLYLPPLLTMLWMKLLASSKWLHMGYHLRSMAGIPRNSMPTPVQKMSLVLTQFQSVMEPWAALRTAVTPMLRSWLMHSAVHLERNATFYFFFTQHPSRSSCRLKGSILVHFTLSSCNRRQQHFLLINASNCHESCSFETDCSNLIQQPTSDKHKLGYYPNINFVGDVVVP